MIHPIQLQIIQALEVLGKANFNKIKPEHIDPKHFVYHLKLLINQGLVVKANDGEYEFTPEGLHALTGLHEGLGFYDAEVNAYIVIMVTHAKKFLTVTRTRAPFLGYTGFLSLHIDKSNTMEDTVKEYLVAQHFEVQDIRLSLVLDNLYREKSSQEILQHSLIFTFVGELANAITLPQKIEEGDLALLTKEQLLAVNKGYSNTVDMIMNGFAPGISYVSRTYEDSL